MGGWGPIVIAGLLCGAVLDARAQDSSSRLSSRCGAEITSSAGRVDRVIDGRSFVLDDGREIRLAALEVPAAAGTSPAGQAARAALAAMLAGETVDACAAPRQRPTAMAARLPMLSPPASRQPRSVAHALLAAGPCPGRRRDRRSRVRRRAATHTSVWPEPPRLGLWGDPQYAIVDGGGFDGSGGRTGSFLGRRRQGVVGPRERRHHICEFWPPMVAGAYGHHIETSGAHLHGRRA